MTPTEFEVRSFWTLAEILRMVPGRRRQLRAWLHAARLVEPNAAGVSIVTRVRLESSMPEVLETMRRSVTTGYDRQRQATK